MAFVAVEHVLHRNAMSYVIRNIRADDHAGDRAGDRRSGDLWVYVLWRWVGCCQRITYIGLHSKRGRVASMISDVLGAGMTACAAAMTLRPASTSV